MSSDKENKKSLGSSVANDIRGRETTDETVLRSVSSRKEEEK
ncbi:MAG: hypothetical protein AB1351_07705 [Thermoproteota archaeon]